MKIKVRTEKTQKSNKKFKRKNWKKTNHKVVSVLKMSDYNRKLFQKKSKLLGGVVTWSSINLEEFFTIPLSTYATK